jgi:hypothetical protein
MSAAQPAPAIIDINLLPEKLRPAQVSGWALAFAGVMALCLLLMIPLAFRMEDARSRAVDAEDLAFKSEYELQAVQAELSQARALRVETDANVAQTQALTQTRAALQGGRRPLAEDMFWLYGFGFLPAGSRITAVDPAKDGLVVTGTAPGPLDGIAYAAKLVGVGGFPAARMTSYAPGERGGVFKVEVTR